MSKIDDFLKKIGFGKTEIISPISERDFEDNNNVALQRYYSDNVRAEEAAREAAQKPQPTQTPKQVQYPEWLANAPAQKNEAVLGDSTASTRSDEVDDFIARVRKEKPEAKNLTDVTLKKLYAKYGEEKLLSSAEAMGVEDAITPTPTKTSVPTPAPNANDFEKKALPILSKYQIPAAVAFGMRDAEGGKIGSHNVFNINAVDSNPSAAFNYNSPEAGIEAYAKLIAEDPRYSKAYAKRNDPDAMIEEITNAGYAGDPRTWKKRSVSTGGAGKMFDSYADFVRNTPGFNRYR